jgi:predicted RNA-binding Zn ribbon-like protein
MASHPQPVANDEPLLLGDHPALDLLNTVAQVDGKLVDSLHSDSDVLQWLARAGWPVEHEIASTRSASLLQTTRMLREAIRTLVQKRKAGKRPDVTVLNEFLAESRSHLELIPKKDGTLELQRQWKRNTPERILAPLAESVADLLANGDFDLIRRCENEECVLWYYDRTKSHHRRWCSMATCGNRHKVAAFRKRQQQNS